MYTQFDMPIDEQIAIEHKCLTLKPGGHNPDADFRQLLNLMRDINATAFLYTSSSGIDPVTESVGLVDSTVTERFVFKYYISYLGNGVLLVTYGNSAEDTIIDVPDLPWVCASGTLSECITTLEQNIRSMQMIYHHLVTEAFKDRGGK